MKEQQGKTLRFGFTFLGSGSSGNAMVVHAPEGDFLLDAGFNAKELASRMELCRIEPEKIRAIVLTHEHFDHVSACRVFAGRYNIPVYLTDETYRKMNRAEKKILPEQLNIAEPGTSFPLCGLSAEPFSVSHDVDTLAYTFQVEDRKLGYATDLGCFGETFLKKMSNCNAVVIEANHDLEMLRTSARPQHLKLRIAGICGHLSNEDSALCIKQILAPCTKQIILAHLSRDCNTPALAEECVRRVLHDMKRDDVSLKLALQNAPLESCWL